MLPLIHLSNFWGTGKISWIHDKINLILGWSVTCVISNVIANQDKKSEIIGAKLYVPVISLSTQNNAKLLKNWNQVLKEHIIGMNINQMQQRRLHNFCFNIWY